MLIYGKEIRESVKEEVKRAAQEHQMKMTIIQVGEEGPSAAYINGIRNFARDVGIDVTVLNFASEISEAELLAKIDDLNRDPGLTGIMLQKPLPVHINADLVVNAIDYHKDVEGIHPFNLGRLLTKEHGVKPTTPKAVIRMLKAHDIDIEGQKVTIVGRSTILGGPLAVMMIAENGTVTVCHTRTRDLIQEIRNADIVVAAMGKMNFITADMVKENSVIIDAGINFDENGKMMGDVHPEARAKARVASAVPGGVGVITVAELFDNLRILAERNQGR
ncbi:MAG: bifunctional methylenetetrahydrofolate dehydrogenase/methenyltetrahydrofolate cyclohydrolase [Firmicutes bacterium HGW-Firmicutes-15]|nr:MAG: bifunctional methylenetetrahydrofolate dehydrogenase/methenyltetrahydrofolate cyclohydrolase [Firmicutes bacterium HGW-Firmicutes-15]